MYIEKFIKNDKNLNKLESYFKSYNLDLDSFDKLYLAYEDEKIIASAGYYKNTLKLFTADSNYSYLNLFDKLLSILIKDMQKLNYKNIFVFTKKAYEDMFKSFNFIKLASAEKSTLLVRTEVEVESQIKNMADFNNPPYSSIVMNANPFTNGHEYLVKKALENSDRLIVFLVENDESYFPFALRKKIALANLKKYKNVYLVDSGDFIISSSTFPSYFLKENLINKDHAIIDSKIFRDYFVDSIGINARYLGEEPIDPSTKIYNETLKSILGEKIKVEIIPRLENNRGLISASTVRLLYKNAKFDEMKDYLSDITIDILREYRNEHFRP